MYSRTVLGNGVRILCEEIKSVQSVAIGIWVAAGSRYEEEAEQGISHFLEHMFFKGTQKRSALDIAQSLESVGGQLNAFTTKEYTCYYARVLKEHYPLAVDVLFDMLLNSKFDPEDISKEQKVILEEINMYEDSPDETVHDLFAQAIWDGHSLGRPVLGSKKSVSDITREDLLGYIERRYQPSRLIISVAGHTTPEETLSLLKPRLETLASRPYDSHSGPPQCHSQVKIIEKPTEQVQICLGVPAFSLNDERIYALQILNNVLGGGISSRLFQTIRENRGLAYTVYSYHSGYHDSGLLAIYAGTGPQSTKDVINMALGEVADIKAHGISDSELKRAQDQIRGSLILGQESVTSHMSRLGRTEVTHERVVTVEEVIERISSVRLEDVADVAKEVFAPDRLSLACIGPIKQGEIEQIEALVKGASI